MFDLKRLVVASNLISSLNCYLSRAFKVSSVHFARSDVSTRSFDFEIELKSGQVLVFNSVEK